jgi:hypothetical protein
MPPAGGSANRATAPQKLATASGRRGKQPLPVFELEPRRCPLCDSTYIKRYDSRSDGFGLSQSWRCFACEERWKWVEPDIEEDHAKRGIES